MKKEASPSLNTLHSAALQMVQAQARDVLLVEDTAAHATLILRALRPYHWSINHVTRAREALKRFEENSNQIVLLDLSLPDSKGFDVLKRMHRCNPQAPIIIVSSTDQVKVSVEAMQHGACNYVVKSDSETIASELSNALEDAWKKRIDQAERVLLKESRLTEAMKTNKHDAIEDTIRTVCDEVNNPLSGVMALSQLLLEKSELNEETQRLVEGIAFSANEVADVVKRLQELQDDNEVEELGTASYYNTQNLATR